jgi:hypothetical protein
VPIRWSACVGLLLLTALGACGSSSDSPQSGTHLEVAGVATLGRGSTAPDPDDPQPIPGPSDAPEVDISGTLECDGPRSVGTGMYAATAVDVCLTVAGQQAAFAEVGVSEDEVCAEVFGGPQHATIKGAIDGTRVDVEVTRDNSCGIQDWQRLEFLLGPPER